MAKKGVLKKVAIEVSKLEGLKQQVNLAQIQEMINCLFDYLHLADVDSTIVQALHDEAGKRLAKRNNLLMKKKIKKIKGK